jgi:tetratricopeptide (TPR) repeat protein
MRNESVRGNARARGAVKEACAVAAEVDVLHQAGKVALGAGEWEAARVSFQAALEQEESAEALYGLGTALYWLAETEAAVHALERAHAEFRHRPDPAQAGFIAVELCLYYAASLGNLAAARGWLGRAARLAADYRLTSLEGWVVLCRAAMANYDSDPRKAERLSRKALRMARDGGSSDLELCALAELGASLVDLGRVTDGLALLDESMAGALGGEAADVSTVIYASCRTIEYSARAAQVKRAVQWIRAADDFNRRYGSAHVHATCRTQYGTILFGLAPATGRHPRRAGTGGRDRRGPRGARLLRRAWRRRGCRSRRCAPALARRQGGPHPRRQGRRRSHQART